MFKYIFLAFFINICVVFSHAQVTNSSPYSRYALGDIHPLWLSQNTALGGSTVALIDSFQVNVLNPASYSFTSYHCPVFDVSLRGRLMQISTSSSTTANNFMSLNNIVLAMPFTKKWGFAFGLMPYSNAGYNLLVSEENAILGGTTYSTYSGEGGIYKLFLGSSFAFIKNTARTLSIGGNASFLFGNNEKTRVMYLPYSSGMYDSKVINSSNTRDFIFDLGLAYREKVNKSQTLTIGASSSIGANINTTRSVFAYTIDPGYGGFVDTVNYIDDDKGTIYIPSRYNIGMTYDFRGVEASKKNRYKLSITSQFTAQDWTKYNENFTSGSSFNDTLRRTTMWNFGMQYIPHTIGVGTGKVSPFKLINYRIGAYYSKNYLFLRGNNINNWGLTAGIGIPLIHSVSYSMLNISYEYGSRGTTNSNLIKETYHGIHVGISVSPNRLVDRWFVKRKYD